MSVYYIQNLDPQVLASRFSTEDVIDPLQQPDEEWKELHLDKIKGIIDRLPDREADLVHLYFFLNKKQTDIAAIFGITQAAVSYRLKRALDRLKFLIELPEATKEDIFEELSLVLPSSLDAQIFSEMYASTCQSEVATILGISQGRVRHRYIANLSRLGQVLIDRTTVWVSRSDCDLYEVKAVADALEQVPAIKSVTEEEFENSLIKVATLLINLPEELQTASLVRFASYYRTFVRIRYNFNILREIKLPKWASRSTKSLDAL